MAIRKTVQAGNPILHKRAKRIRDFKSRATKQIIRDLTDTMRHTELVGMAAPQIGKSERIFVTEIRPTKLRRAEPDKLKVYMNPKITWSSKKQTEIYEGCGSIANGNFFGAVKRPATVTVEATDERGEQFTLTASGVISHIIQHELDHLNGILFTERMHDMKKVMSREEYVKYRKEQMK